MECVVDGLQVIGVVRIMKASGVRIGHIFTFSLNDIMKKQLPSLHANDTDIAPQELRFQSGLTDGYLISWPQTIRIE
jgi:hypothetical protein